MNPETIKKALRATIQAMTDCKWFFSTRPGKDYTRNRKFPFQKVISSILAFGSGTRNHEIMDFFGLDPSVGTSSAFIQRRAAILPEAFECLFQHFTKKVDEDLRQHRIMGQGDSARDFAPSESMENVGILNVFPIFHTARLGQKIRRSPPLPLCGVALNKRQFWRYR